MFLNSNVICDKIGQVLYKHYVVFTLLLLFFWKLLSLLSFRYRINTGTKYDRIKHLLPQQRGNVEVANLTFLCALQYIAENGCPIVHYCP